MGDSINAVTVSLDLPFAMNRFCDAESIENLKVGSDYQDRTFGANWGTLIEELKILCRACFVLDADGKVTHAEYVGEVTDEPNYDAALARAQSVSPSFSPPPRRGRGLLRTAPEFFTACNTNSWPNCLAPSPWCLRPSDRRWRVRAIGAGAGQWAGAVGRSRGVCRRQWRALQPGGDPRLCVGRQAALARVYRTSRRK